MKIKKSVILNSYNGEYSAYDSSTSIMHELNESAYFIVENISKKTNQDELIKLYSAQFDLTDDQATIDVNQFLNLLKSSEIIE